MTNQNDDISEHRVDNNDDDDDDNRLLLPLIKNKNDDSKESGVVNIPAVISVNVVSNVNESDELVNFLPTNSVNADENELIAGSEQISNSEFKEKMVYFSDLLVSALIFGPLTGFYWLVSFFYFDLTQALKFSNS